MTGGIKPMDGLCVRMSKTNHRGTENMSTQVLISYANNSGKTLTLGLKKVKTWMPNHNQGEHL